MELLLNRFEDIDVLSRNEFGRGCVTEAFQTEDTELGMCFTINQMSSSFSLD